MKRTKNTRWMIILGAMIVLSIVLIWRLHKLMIVQGEHYRQIAQSKRIREVEITAPRGNIYDRNGKLLAGTRASFAIIGYKDDLMGLERAERNDTLSRLISFIERDGVSYLDSYPIGINDFVYEPKARYLSNSESPRAKAQRLLQEKKLIKPWLEMVYTDASEPSYRVSVAARALTAMSLKGSALPIKADPDDGFKLSFVHNEKYKALEAAGAITKKSDPLEVLAASISDNSNLIATIMDHPAVRKLTIDLLRAHKLEEDITLSAYTYAYDLDFIQNKASLHQKFPSISFDSSAKDDFVTIVKARALDGFLQGITVDSDNRFIVPAETLINKLEALGEQTNLTYKIADNAQSVSIRFEKEENTLEQPLDRLKRLAEKHSLYDELIVDEKHSYIAEQAMFEAGIYPRISRAKWNYSYETDQADFMERYDLQKLSAGEAFAKLKADRELTGVSNDIKALGIMMITDKIRAQGNYAYSPVHLCYELSEQTVAMITENIPTDKGLMVSREPIRYYPYGESAAHILGYIGRISSSAETKKYVDKKGYMPNDLIGKTGVEESFEDTLHGVKGKEIVLVNSYGNRTETVQRIEPKSGNNLYLTIDIDLQLASEDSLKRGILSTKYGYPFTSKWGNVQIAYSPSINSGATVSTDPNTGALLAMASYPSYDPNLFVTGISNSDWNDLLPENEQDINEARPLMNLATQAAIQPGSTFKIVTSLAALEKGLTREDRITDSGFIDIGNQTYNCLIYSESGGTHGRINVEEAIGVSCNYFFYVLGLGEDPHGNPAPGIKVDVEDLQRIVVQFGMNERSGLEINLPYETKGNVPSREGKLGLTKTLLRYYLEANLAKYKKTGVFKNQETMSSDIDTVVSWVDKGASLGRQALIEALDKLGYEPEKPLKDSYTGLADIIKYTYLNQADWTQADMMSTVIGQGQNAYTPIAINRMAATVGNGGTRYATTLVKEIRSHDNKTVVFAQQPRGEQIQLSRMGNLDVVREGMRQSAQGPTSYPAMKTLPFELGSKTGTAERAGADPITGEGYPSYAWHMAFAPLKDPQISTVTFLPSGRKSINAVAISRDIIASYLKAKPTDPDADLTIYNGLSTKTVDKSKEGSNANTNNDAQLGEE